MKVSTSTKALLSHLGGALLVIACGSDDEVQPQAEGGSTGGATWSPTSGPPMEATTAEETSVGTETTGELEEPFALEHRLLWRVTRDDGGSFPYRVVALGDVNGDGLGDFAAAGDGKTFVVFGKDDLQDVRSEDIEAGIGGFVIAFSPGPRLAAAGDVNGDGLADILVGQRPCPSTSWGNIDSLTSGSSSSSCGDDDPPEPEEEKTFVVFGKDDGAPVHLEDVALGDGGYVIVGAAAYVAGGHDANGDGLADVLLVAGGNTKFRDKFLVLGKADTAPIVLAEAEIDRAALRFEGEGNQLDFIGDFDGDGHVDIAVSARWHSEYWPIGASHYGVVYVVFGSSDPAHVTLEEIEDGDTGIGVLLIGRGTGSSGGGGLPEVKGVPGDVDGDGLADVVIRHQGDWIVVRGASDREWVWLPDRNEPDERVLGTIVRRHPDGWGWGAIAGLGDLDGDGRDDVARTLEIPAPPPDGIIQPPPPWGPSDGCIDVLLGAGDPATSWASDRLRCDLECGWSLAGEDVDGNGTRELLATDMGENVVLVYGFTPRFR